MLPGQGFRNFVWFVSIVIGPGIAYYLINIRDRTEWICEKLNLCSIKLFVFYAMGFLAVWAIYWTFFLIVRAIRAKITQ